MLNQSTTGVRFFGNTVSTNANGIITAWLGIAATSQGRVITTSYPTGGANADLVVYPLDGYDSGSATGNGWTMSGFGQLWTLLSVDSVGFTAAANSDNADPVTDCGAYGGASGDCSPTNPIQQPVEWYFNTTGLVSGSASFLNTATLSDGNVLDSDDSLDDGLELSNVWNLPTFTFANPCSATLPLTLTVNLQTGDTLSGALAEVGQTNSVLCNPDAGLAPAGEPDAGTNPPVGASQLWGAMNFAFNSYASPQTFMLTQVPVANYQAEYTSGSTIAMNGGTTGNGFQVDNAAGTPVGMAVAANIFLAMNLDFTYSTNSYVQFGVGGPCGIAGTPASTWQADDPAALSNGWAFDSNATSPYTPNGGVGVTGIQVGDVAVLVVGDGSGATLVLVGSTTDANGANVPDGYLFWTYFVATSGGTTTCAGSYANDSFFQRVEKFTAPTHPTHPLPPHHRPRNKFDRRIDEIKAQNRADAIAKKAKNFQFVFAWQ